MKFSFLVVPEPSSDEGQDRTNPDIEESGQSCRGGGRDCFHQHGGLSN